MRWLCPVTGRARIVEVQFDTADDRLLARSADWVFDLAAPSKLEPITIAKPWGEEIWHTGMEARGESRVSGLEGSLPLSAFLALAPAQIAGDLPVVLLKILASRAEAALGELYLEVHREKAEAYLVTAVDEGAWPGRRALLRYGINQQLRAQVGNDQQLRAQVAMAARALEVKPNDTSLRQQLEALIGTIAIEPGSRLQLTPGVPHGLPNGVRVVEFQTPSYERLILAASQPVATQPHWDCAAAADAMTLDAVDPMPVSRYPLPAGQRALAGFDNFGARTLTLDSALPRQTLPPTRGAAVLMCTVGRVAVGELSLGPEEAALVPQRALERGVNVALAVGCSNAELVIAGADF